jgi:hypothetical protein
MAIINAVQVSVDPCAVRALALGDNLMHLTPIVFACPPKRHHRRRKVGRMLHSRETVLEVRRSHDQLWVQIAIVFLAAARR